MTAILCVLIINVYGYASRDIIPEIPDDTFINSIHNGPLNEKILPNIRIHDKQLFGEALLNRHQNKLKRLIRNDLFESNDNNHYYSGI